jgi:uncharacterized OB-fold protein
MGSRCKDYGALFVLPRSICVKCYSSEMEWVEMKGEGRLAAFTCITVAPPFMMAEGMIESTLVAQVSSIWKKVAGLMPVLTV